MISREQHTREKTFMAAHRTNTKTGHYYKLTAYPKIQVKYMM
jgi:hypothetical protein